MRLRWVELALFLVLAVLTLNQYPAFGTPEATRGDVIQAFSLTYLSVAILLLFAGLGLHLARATGRLTGLDEVPRAMGVLAAGLFMAYWLLEIMRDSGQEAYQNLSVVAAGLVLVALALLGGSSGEAPRARLRIETGPPDEGSDEEVRELIVLSEPEETREGPVEGVR